MRATHARSSTALASSSRTGERSRRSAPSCSTTSRLSSREGGPSRRQIIMGRVEHGIRVDMPHILHVQYHFAASRHRRSDKTPKSLASASYLFVPRPCTVSLSVSMCCVVEEYRLCITAPKDSDPHQPTPPLLSSMPCLFYPKMLPGPDP